LFAADGADGDFLDFFLAGLHFAEGQGLKIEATAEAATFFGAEAGGGFR
jgi:hypothetical protein